MKRLWKRVPQETQMRLHASFRYLQPIKPTSMCLLRYFSGSLQALLCNYSEFLHLQSPDNFTGSFSVPSFPRPMIRCLWRSHPDFVFSGHPSQIPRSEWCLIRLADFSLPRFQVAEVFFQAAASLVVSFFRDLPACESPRELCDCLLCAPNFLPSP